MKENCRFELSFKNIKELENKLNFCTLNEIKKINIPCKGNLKKDFYNETFEYINKNYEDLDVFYHYSLYHQYRKNREISYRELLNFIKQCNFYRNKKILLVSGSIKKKDFDVINVLNDLKLEKNNSFNLGIAFNPYLEKYFGILGERENHEEKINSGLVKSIWFQFGTDIKTLETEINYIKKINNNKDIDLFGSLIIPSKQFISRFKFRPWKGVYILPYYLKSLESFICFTKDLINFYIDNNICPVIETEFYSQKTLKSLTNFFNN